MASTPCWRNARPRRSTVRWLPNWWSGNPPAARYKHSATHRRQYFSLDTEMRVTHYSYVLIKPFYGFCAIHPVTCNREVIEAVSTGPGFSTGHRWRGAIAGTETSTANFELVRRQQKFRLQFRPYGWSLAAYT